MSDHFPGFGVRGYRSFDTDKVQWIRLHPDTTVILGPNNSGKSNVLRLIQDIAPKIVGHESSLTLHPHEDYHDGPDKRIGIFWPMKRPDPAPDRVDRDGQMTPEKFFDILTQLSDGCRPHAYFEWTPESEKCEIPTDFAERVFEKVKSLGVNDRHFSSFTSDQVKQAQGPIDNVKALIKFYSTAMYRIESPFSISALRYIRPGVKGKAIDGGGMIEEIKRFRSPPADDLDSPRLFKELCSSVEELLGFADVELVVPDESDELVIRHDGKQLPLSSLGTGTEHALIVLTAAVTNPGRVVCIEEPELHLHPRLQRKLVQTLSERSSSQLILTTHSATFVDMPDASYIQVKLTEGATQTINVTSDGLIDAIRDLGVRASDVMQSNFVIWVEGPSDRIYLRRWLEIVDPNLEENRDYSMVFSGGALIAHLGTHEDETLIDLRRLNQNFAIMSDLDDPESPKPAFERLREELQGEDSWRFWATAGRTVENLVPDELLDDAVTKVHPTTKGIDRTETGVDLLTRIERKHKDGGYLRKPNKVAIAIEVVEHLDSLDHSDELKTFVEKLAHQIRVASD